MEEARAKALQEQTEYYESKILEKNMQLEQAADEQRQQLKEGEELQKQTEEDADHEILDLKNRYERQLRQRLEENTKLRGEVGILTKKVSPSFVMGVLGWLSFLSMPGIMKATLRGPFLNFATRCRNKLSILEFFLWL